VITIGLVIAVREMVLGGLAKGTGFDPTKFQIELAPADLPPLSGPIEIK
jgi:hypothetical protein